MTLCASVHGYLGPRGGLRYASCTLKRGHDPYDQHNDGVRRWQGPEIYWYEFDPTRAKAKSGVTRLKAKVRICKKCGEQGCDCNFLKTMTTNNQGQIGMFTTDAMEREYQADMIWLDGFIAEQMEAHRMAQDAEFEPYFGSF